MSKQTLNPRKGNAVLFSNGLIGVVKYVGPITSASKTTFYGIKIGDGSGDCNGTFQGKQFFKCPEGKGTFVELKQIKKVISSETLLDKVVYLNKQVKIKNAEISKLNDELNLTKKKVEDFSSSKGAKAPVDSDTDEAIGSFLNQELNKKWYISLNDTQVRYPKRAKKEVETIYAKFDSKFKSLPEQPAHTRIVYTVCASKRDNLIGSGSDDKTIRLWRHNPGNQKKSYSLSRCHTIT